MYDAVSRPDMYTSIYATIDILSTADIRSRRESQYTHNATILNNLSKIIEHERLITFLISQRANYQRRKRIIEQRVERGFSNQSELIPLEQQLISVETSLQGNYALVRESQLNIASLAGSKWEELYEVVKLWDRTL